MLQISCVCILTTKSTQQRSCFVLRRTVLLKVINRTTQLTADAVLIHESHSDSEIVATTYDKKTSSPKRAETFGGFDRRPSQKTPRRTTTTIPEGTLEENHVAQSSDSGLSLTSKKHIFTYIQLVRSILQPCQKKNYFLRC